MSLPKCLQQLRGMHTWKRCVCSVNCEINETTILLSRAIVMVMIGELYILGVQLRGGHRLHRNRNKVECCCYCLNCQIGIMYYTFGKERTGKVRTDKGGIGLSMTK
jgi:hypothetical protein